jgi:hypothetical protein
MAYNVKPGDLAFVIQGALGPNGPNTGKIVTVCAASGAPYDIEHTLHGKIWKCVGSSLVSEMGVPSQSLDFADDWLRRIDPPKLQKTISTELDVMA